MVCNRGGERERGIARNKTGKTDSKRIKYNSFNNQIYNLLQHFRRENGVTAFMCMFFSAVAIVVV